MENITVGYDGSPAADSALRWVATRSLMRPTRVTVAGVDDAVHSTQEMLLRIRAGRDLLRQLNPDAEVTTQLIKGRPARALSTGTADADLLVIGVHTDAPTRAALMGFTALRLAARAAVPVVLVPEGWSPSVGPVVIGYDVDGSSDAALAFAQDEAVEDKRTLRIVHVWDGVGEEAHRLHGVVVDGAAEQARHNAPALEAVPVLVAGAPAPALMKESADASLLVIGGHHRGVWMGGLLGALSWELIGTVHVPLCVVSPSEESLEDDTDARTEEYAGVL